MDFGDWTGFNWDEVREKFGVHPYEWLDEIELGVVPNGENGVQFRTRVEAVPASKSSGDIRGETVAIFCHGGVIRMMLSILLDLPLPKTNSFEIEYTSVTQVALHPHLNEIELLNFTPWRDLGEMKRKFLWRISVRTTPEAEDAVAELFERNPRTARLVLSRPSKPASARLRFIFSRNWNRHTRFARQIFAGLKRINSCGLNIGSGKIIIAKVRREDWAESWKRHFKPIEIGNALLIKPSWSKRRPRKDQAVVVLDPGLSFGTGQHPTTAFCLHQIVAAVCERRSRHPPSAATVKSFLDIGTGSGILAIAAAKLGYTPVHALDFDPEAVRVARANARANRIHQELKIPRGDVTKLPICPGQREQQYDLVCANLISTLLIAERRRIVAQLNPAELWCWRAF